MEEEDKLEKLWRMWNVEREYVLYNRIVVLNNGGRIYCNDIDLNYDKNHNIVLGNVLLVQGNNIVAEVPFDSIVKIEIGEEI